MVSATLNMWGAGVVVYLQTEARFFSKVRAKPPRYGVR